VHLVTRRVCPTEAIVPQAELGDFQQSLAVQKIEHKVGICVGSSLCSIAEECAGEDMGDTCAEGDSPIQLVPSVSFERPAHVRSRHSRFVTSDQSARDVVDPVLGVCQPKIQVLADNEQTAM